MPIVPHIILQLFVAAVDAGIGLYVLFQNPRGLVNRSFCVFAVGIAAWASSVALLGYTQLFFFGSAALYSGHLMIAGMVLLAETFPNTKRLEKRFILVFIPLAVVTILTPFHVFIRSAVRGAGGNIEPTNGPLFPLLAVVVVGYIVFSGFLLIRHYLRLKGIAKTQMLSLIWGAGVFIIGMFVADLLLPSFGLFQFNMLGPVFSIIFVGLTAYAIVRYQFMDIHVIIKRSISYAFVIMSVAVVFFGFEFIVEKYFYNNDEVVDIIAATVGAVAFLRFKNFFEKVTDRVFFRRDYDYTEMTQELGPLLNATINLETLLGSIQGFLEKTLKPKFTVFVFENNNEVPAGYDIFSQKQPPHFEKEASLLMEIASALPREPIFIQEIGIALDADQYHEISDIAKNMGIAAIVPLFSKEGRMSILFLAEKRSDGIFSPKDKELLAVLSHQAGMAIENSRLYERIKRSNEDLEQRVADRTQQIKSMYETQSQFLTDISHELQTPIAILRGNLELLEKGRSGGGKEATRVVRNTVDGMSRLVTNLLGIAKLNFSKNKFYKMPVNVEVLLEEVHGDCFILGKNKGIDFSFSSEVLIASGDKDKLKEVLLNLLSNAFAHTPRGGSVFLGASKSGKYVEIVVADTGSGIAPENIPHIFDRFYKIHSEGSKGNGIGLNICRQIIEAHSGTITVESEHGKGSRFLVRLPLAE